MPKYLVVNDRGEARRLEKILRRLMGLPAPGVRPDGRPARVGDTPGPGWTIRAARFVKHPTDTRLAVRVTDRMRDAWRDHRMEHLTLAQRQGLADRLTTQAELAAEWKRDDGEGGTFIPESEELEPL